MKIFILNWKMNPGTLEEAKGLFKDTLGIARTYKDKAFTVICPSFVHLVDCAHILATEGDNVSVALGAQNIAHLPSGALTGEVSVQMLKDVKSDYVLIGHSERRYQVKESSENIKSKILNALAFGIVPVLFIGEVEKDSAWQDHIIDQLNEAVGGLDQEQISRIIFVYEPVWAISSGGRMADFDKDHAKEAVIFIRGAIAKLTSLIDSKNIIVLYGGSVNQSMVKDLIKIDEYNGAVIGSISLKPDDLQSVFANC